MLCLLCLVGALLGLPTDDHLHPEDGDDGIVTSEPLQP